MSGRMLTRNAAFCRKCEQIIVSQHRHDFVTCKCGDIAVDGGLDYERRVFRDGAQWEERCEYTAPSVSPKEPNQ